MADLAAQVASLTFELEQARSQAETLDREKKAAERQLDLLRAEEGGDGKESYAILADAKKRLEKEVKRLNEKLEEEKTARSALELTAHQGQSELTFVKDVIQDSLEDKLEKLESTRRSLLTTNQQQSQELQLKNREIEQLKRLNATLEAENKTIQSQLEIETEEHQQQAAARRTAANQAKELKQKLDIEQAKVADLTQQTITWRSKALGLETQLNAYEINNDRLNRKDSTAEAALKELQGRFKASQDAQKNAEEAARQAIHQLDELKERLDEDADELTNVSRAKRQLEAELALLKSTSAKEVQVREKALEELRQKNLKDVHQLTVDLDSERAASLLLRSQLKELTLRFEQQELQLEEERRAKQQSQSEAQRQATRASDYQRAYQEVAQTVVALREDIERLKAEVSPSKTTTNNDAEDEIVALQKAKQAFEKKYKDAELENERLSRENAVLTKKVSNLTAELEEQHDLLEDQINAVVRSEEKLRRVEFQLAEVNALRIRDQQAREALDKLNHDLQKEVKDLQNQLVVIDSTYSMDGGRTRRQYEQQITQLQEQIDAAGKKTEDVEKALRKASKLNSEALLRVAEAERSRALYEDMVQSLEAKLRKLQAELEDSENAASDRGIALKRAQREAEDAADRARKFEREANRFKAQLSRLA